MFNVAHYGPLNIYATVFYESIYWYYLYYKWVQDLKLSKNSRQAFLSSLSSVTTTFLNKISIVSTIYVAQDGGSLALLS